MLSALPALFPMDPRLAFGVLALALAFLIGLALRAMRQGQALRYTGIVFAAGVVATLQTAVAVAVLA